MKPVVYACMAVLLYALGNVVTEQKLKPYTQFAIMVYCYIPMVVLTVCAIGWKKMQAQPISFPSGQALYFAGIIAIVFFLADTFFFSAYTNNADSFTVSAIALMFPAAASLMKYFWTGQTPNRYHIAAYLVAIVAVVLAERGNQIQLPPIVGVSTRSIP
jgi:drug/metabolite transporter (DMT)-like permease